MPRRADPIKYRKIRELAQVIVHADGEPNQYAIAKLLNTSRGVVKRALEREPEGILDTPVQANVDASIEQLYAGVQHDIIPKILDGWQGNVDRYQSEANDKNGDARDLRHIAQAMDTATKLLQLLSGRVTSRSQQQTTIERTDTVRIIEIPSKGSEAIEQRDGLKPLPTSYDIDTGDI